MPQITLGEQTYLMNFLQKYFPEATDLWEITEVVSRPQRGKLLALCYHKKVSELTDMLDDIRNFQLSRKEQNVSN